MHAEKQIYNAFISIKIFKLKKESHGRHNLIYICMYVYTLIYKYIYFVEDRRKKCP